MPRIGTTTQAIMLTRFLNEAGIKACYVEENNSQSAIVLHHFTMSLFTILTEIAL